MAKTAKMVDESGKYDVREAGWAWAKVNGYKREKKDWASEIVDEDMEQEVKP